MEENEVVVKKDGKSVLIIVAAIVAVALAGAAVVAFTPKTKPGPSNAANSATQNTSSDEMPGVATVIFTSKGFSPAELTVKKGTIVTVENQSDDSLVLASGDHDHHDDSELNLPELKAGEATTFTATTVGTHEVHDHLDDSKIGKITITE